MKLTQRNLALIVATVAMIALGLNLLSGCRSNPKVQASSSGKTEEPGEINVETEQVTLQVEGMT